MNSTVGNSTTQAGKIVHEHHLIRYYVVWSAISQPYTLSFLGLDWSPILPSIRKYISPPSVAFELLSDLQLCPIRASIVNSYQSRHKIPPEIWLYKQYRQYAIRVQDFGETIRQYHIPLIDATVTPAPYPSSPALSESANSDLISRMVPQPLCRGGSSTCRLIIFPQTRYSFIEDEVFSLPPFCGFTLIDLAQMFQALYPLPEEQVKRMAHKLLHRFQGNNGYHNVLPDPFADSFTQKSYDGRGVRDFRYFAAMYPVIEFEFVADYKSRKMTEKFITSMQQQNRKNFPTISQWRYSRKFDVAEESNLRTEVFQSDTCPERIQSARALFEYACGDHDTLKLDARQTSLLEGHEARPTNGKRLLVVDPLWLLIFPESGMNPLAEAGLRNH
jgi:hypothetical protein